MLELKVVMDMENMTSCQLSVNNWDDRSFDLKYSDKATFDVSIAVPPGVEALSNGVLVNRQQQVPGWVRFGRARSCPRAR